MVMYPNYVLGETTLSLLQMHIALYEQGKDQFKSEQPMILAAVEATMPRVELELGLFYGKVDPINSAINQEREIPPYSPGEAIVLVLKKPNQSLHAVQLKFCGSNERVNWKEWRIEGIAEGEFTESHFAPYGSAKIEDITNSNAKFYSNSPKEVGRRETSITDHPIEMIIQEVQELERSARYRYVHQLEFPKNLSPSEKSVLASLNKAQYL
ncbi:hypothetical protein HOA92_07595 [archaeon]|jgi:hypothetical protein|nr:hypothetical protein [archaeon]MBT6762877.1 hypothetical protein [archaeon]MBT7706914.1 hypothetical protein [archaeon]